LSIADLTLDKKKNIANIFTIHNRIARMEHHSIKIINNRSDNKARSQTPARHILALHQKTAVSDNPKLRIIQNLTSGFKPKEFMGVVRYG